MSKAAALLLKRYAVQIKLIRNEFGLPYREYGDFNDNEWAKKQLYQRLDQLANDMQDDANILLENNQ